MGTSQNSAGLRLEDHNKLKYAIALTRVGQEVFSWVFGWGFTGGTKSIKETLLELPSYSNARYRKDFSASQRNKIEKGDPSVMDITLLYRLLQLVCGLRDQNDEVWITPTSDSLEYCLYALKTKRNEVAHEDMVLSPSQLMDRMDNIKELLISTIYKASLAFMVNVSDQDSFISHTSCQLDAIKNSPVPLSTIAEYEKELMANRRACVIEEGQREMAHLCKTICQTSVVPCLTELAVNVKDVYTEPKLRRDETQITQRQLTAMESHINIHNIFETEECDGYLPDIIVVSSLSGMGKSTMLKYITEKAVNDTSVFKNIEKHDLLLFLECRNITFSCVDELTSLLLPRTSSMFQPKDFTQSLLTVDFLLMLDDVEELDPHSFAVLLKFIRLVSPGTRIVLTSSREKAKHVHRRMQGIHKRAMLLELEGITESKTLKHLQRILNNIPAKVQNKSNEQKLYELIQTKYPYLQEHLRSPEILGLIAFSWSYAPDRINSTTTVTEIFLLVEDLLVHKIFLSLASSTLPGMHELNSINSNLYELLFVLSDIAAETLSKGKFSIERDDIQKIINKCLNLGLPKSIISTFLNYMDEQNTNPLVASPRVSFPRRSTLQYYAAWFVTQRLKEASQETSIKDMLHFAGTDEGALSNYQAMAKYLVGMIAALIPSQLESRAKEIVSMLKELDVKKASQWVQYIEEAKEHPSITQEILREMGDEWDIEDYAISSTFCNILFRSPPRKLTLTVCVSPSDLPHLPEVLNSCKNLNDTTLSLHMYKHFWSEKTEFSDQYLKTLIDNNPLCKLEHFAGRISEDTIPLLPTSLKRLALHLIPAMIETLNTCLAKLSELQMLYINFDICETIQPASINSLDIRKSIILSVDFWRISPDKVEWACNVARALSSTYARLVLRHSSLDANSCLKWLKGLHERNLNVSWIVVGSTCDISEEEDSQLQHCARNTGCRKFVWLKI